MTRRAELRFVVSGGAAEGLGHVMRCATLAREAHARGAGVSFALQGDAAAAAVLAAEVPEARVTPWCDADVAGAHWTLFDTRAPIHEALAAVRNAGGRTLVLDRVDHLDDADLTVVPAAHAREASHPRLLAGAAFCVLHPCFLAEPAPPYAGSRDVLLVTLGGADPLGLSARVCAALDAAWSDAGSGPFARRHCVLGSACTAGPDVEGALRAWGWSVHRNLSRAAMRQLMTESLGAVAGFGTTWAELACTGVPTLTLTHHRRDLDDAERLEARGLAASAGWGGALEADRLAERATHTLGDAGWRERTSRAARAALGDGRGAARILDALENARTGRGRPAA